MIARALIVLTAVAVGRAALADSSGTGAAAPATSRAARLAVAHIALRRSTPADGDTLSAAPRRLALEFNEAVELPVASVTLLGPGAATIALSPLRHDGERRTHLLAEVEGPLEAGTYTIQWAIVGRDGHPIRGEVHFTLPAGASGLAPPPADTVLGAEPGADSAESPGSGGAGDEGTPGGDTFDATSPAFAAIRALTYLGLLGVIGTLAVRVGVLARLRRRDGDGFAGSELVAATLPRVARAGLVAGAMLAAGVGLRLLAQVRAVYGDGGFDGAAVLALLTGTAWGWGWLLQLAATAVALGAIWATRRCTPVVAGDVTLACAAIGLAVSAAMSGHAMAAHPMPAAVAFDAAHVLAAGGWIGALFFVVAAAIPAALAGAPDARTSAVRGVVVTFSPLALLCAGTIAATGIGSAWLQLRSLEALWASEYGRVLLIKLAFVAAVLAAGAYNWRVVTPRLAGSVGVASPSRSMSAELAFAFVVLVVTAVLVAIPPPADLMHVASAGAGQR